MQYEKLVSYDGSGSQNVTLDIGYQSNFTLSGDSANPTGLYGVRFTDQASQFQWKNINMATLMEVPASNPNSSWAQYKIQGQFDNDAGVTVNVIFYLTDVTQTTGHMRMQVHNSAWTQMWFDQTQTNWDQTPVGITMYGFYPMFSNQGDADLASPDGSGSVAYNLSGSTYYMPNGRTAGVDAFFGTIGMTQMVSFDSSLTAEIGLDATGSNVAMGTPINERYPAEFNGTDSYAEIPHTTTPDFSSKVSISIWFKTVSTSEGVIWQKAYGPSGGDSVFSLSVNTSGNEGKATVTWRDNSGSHLHTLTSSSAVNDNLWHHAVVTYDVHGGISFFLDGFQAANSVYPQSGLTFSPDMAFQVGRWAHDSHPSQNFFDGLVDDLRIYDRMIYSSEAPFLYDFTRVLDPAMFPVISIDQTVANLGDVLTSTADLKGGTIEYFAWEYLDDNGSWVAFLGAPDTQLAATVLANLSEKDIQVSVRTQNGWGFSGALTVPNLTSQLNPVQTLGFYPTYGTSAEAALHPQDGAQESELIVEGGLSFYMPKNLNSAKHGDYGLKAIYEFSHDMSDGTGSSPGTLHGGAQAGVSDSNRDVLAISSAGDYGQIPASLNIGSGGAYSFSAWIKLDDLTNRQVLLSDHVSGSTYPSLFVDVDGGNLRVIHYNTNGTSNQSLLSASSLVPGQWQFIAVTWDGSTASIYIDGSLDASGALTHVPWSSTIPYRIGADTSGHNIVGGIDTLQIWDRALPSEEVAYQKGISTVSSTSDVTAEVLMQDTYGDGWTGGSVTIQRQDNAFVVYHTYGPTAAQGTGVISSNEAFEDDTAYTWNASGGSYPSEIRFSLWLDGVDLLNGALASGVTSANSGTFTIGSPTIPPVVASSVSSFTENQVVVNVTMNSEATSISSGWAYRLDADFTSGAHGGTFVSIGNAQATIPVSPGANTIYIAAVDSSGNITAVAPSLSVNTQVIQLTVTKTDSYGDGWNNHEFKIFDGNGSEVANQTLLTGGLDSPVISQIQLPAGTYTWTMSGGNYPGEVGFDLTDPEGVSLASVATGTLTSAGTNGSFTLAASGPTITGTASVSGDVVTVAVGGSAPSATHWVATLSPISSEATSVDPGIARVEYAQDYAITLNSNGNYTVYLAALNASDEVVAVDSISVSITTIPSVQINESNPFVGDTLSLTVDLGGKTVQQGHWQRYDTGTSNWLTVLTTAGSTGSYTLTEAENNHAIQFLLEFTDGTHVLSAPVNAWGLSDQLEANYVLSSILKDKTGSNDGYGQEGMSFGLDADANDGAGRHVATITGGRFLVPNAVMSSINNQYSISMWVKPSGFAHSYNYLLSNKYSAIESSIEVSFDQNGSLCVKHKGENLFGSGHPHDIKSWGGTQAAIGAWSHIVVTWDKQPSEDGRLKFFLNGVQLGANAGHVMNIEPWANPNALKVGDTGDVSGYEGFQGKVADLKIWSNELSEIEVQRLYDNKLEPETDIISPVFSWQQPNPYLIPNSPTPLLAYQFQGISDVIHASDNVDGDITAHITAQTAGIDTNNDGHYTITYTVNDSSLNTISEDLDIHVATVYQIPNDDYSLSFPAGDSGWRAISGQTSEKTGITEYTVTHTGQSPTNIFMVSGNTTPDNLTLQQGKTYDNLVSHNAARIKFDYYGIKDGTSVTLRVDGVAVKTYTSADFITVPEVVGGEISSSFSWAIHRYLPIDIMIPHTGSSMEVRIDVGGAYTHTRYAFTPVEIYLDGQTVSATPNTSYYVPEINETDNYIIFLNGDVVSPSNYSISGSVLNFSVGVLAVGDTITCLKVG